MRALALVALLFAACGDDAESPSDMAVVCYPPPCGPSAIWNAQTCRCDLPDLGVQDLGNHPDALMF